MSRLRVAESGGSAHDEARRRRRRRWRRSTLPPWASTIAATIARPSPAPPRAALAAALGAPEALEQRVGVVGRQARAVVAHLERARRRPSRSTATSIGVPAGVCTSALRSRLASTWRSWCGVAEHDRRAVGVERRSSRSGAVARASSTASRGERGEVDLGSCGASRDLVEARERQQVLDQHAHARGLVLDPPHRLLDVGSGSRAAPMRNSSA